MSINNNLIEFSFVKGKSFDQYVHSAVLGLYQVFRTEEIVVDYNQLISPGGNAKNRVHVFLQSNAKLLAVCDDISYKLQEASLSSRDDGQPASIVLLEMGDDWLTAHKQIQSKKTPTIGLNKEMGLGVFACGSQHSFAQGLAFTSFFSLYAFQLSSKENKELYSMTVGQSGNNLAGQLMGEHSQLSSKSFTDAATAASCTLKQSFVNILENCCKQYGNERAIECENHFWTYRDLWTLSCILARRLEKFGIRPSKTVQNATFVGVFMDRSAELVISMLSCFVSGAVYVPLDPSLAHQRLKSVIEDANIKIILSRSRMIERVETLLCGSSTANENYNDKQDVQLIAQPVSVKTEIVLGEQITPPLDITLHYVTSPDDRSMSDCANYGQSSSPPKKNIAAVVDNIASFQTSTPCLENTVSNRQAVHFDGNGDSSPQNLAYCIYTSGSTGVPKGVLVRNEGPVNCIMHLCDLFCQQTGYKKYVFSEEADDSLVSRAALSPGGSRPGFLFLNPISFDQSIKTLMVPLLLGHRLVILPGMGAQGISFDEIESIIRVKDISYCVTVPTLFSNLLNSIPDVLRKHLTLVNLGGEKVTNDLLFKCRQTLSSDTVIVNTYGPTETSISATAASFQCGGFSRRTHVPIGRPLPHVKAWVLNDELQPCPVGIAGVLHLGGCCVAAGYTRTELEEGKFVKFSGEIVYCTGDQCYWLSDGQLVFLRRVDEQGKVNGIRVEPDEIRLAALRHPSVLEAAVVLQTDRAHLFVQSTLKTEQLDASAVHKLVQQYIPAQVVVHVHALSFLPVNAAGKTDHRGLEKWLLENGKGTQSGGTAGSPPVAEPGHLVNAKEALENILKKYGLFDYDADQYSVDEWDGLLRKVYLECEEAGVLCWSQIFGQPQESATTFSATDFISNGVSLHNASTKIVTELAQFANAHFASKITGNTCLTEVGLSSVEIMYLTQFINHRFQTKYMPGMLFTFGNHTLNRIGMRVAVKQQNLALSSSTSVNCSPDVINNDVELRKYCNDWAALQPVLSGARDSAHLLQLVERHSTGPTTLVYKTVAADDQNINQLNLRARLFLTPDCHGVTRHSNNSIMSMSVTTPTASPIVVYIPTYHPFIADTQFVPQCLDLTLRGISSVIGYYRSPFLEGSINDAVRDICSLVCWIRQNISGSRKVFVAGASASGYLALKTLLQQNNDDVESNKGVPDGLILYSAEFGLKGSTINVLNFSEYREITKPILLLYPHTERPGLVKLYRWFMDIAGSRTSLQLFPGQHGSFNYQKEGYLPCNRAVGRFLEENSE